MNPPTAAQASTRGLFVGIDERDLSERYRIARARQAEMDRAWQQARTRRGLWTRLKERMG